MTLDLLLFIIMIYLNLLEFEIARNYNKLEHVIQMQKHYNICFVFNISEIPLGD